MLNRAIQAQQAPGSTFKPIVALAGLETGTIDDAFTVHCPGGASFYGHYYHCHLKGGHGTVSLHKGIVQSCDVYFYNVANKLGIDNIAFYADIAGYGHATGIDLPQRICGRGALHRVEDADFPAEVVRRGNHFGGNRPGRAHRDAAAVGARLCRYRHGRRVASLRT